MVPISPPTDSLYKFIAIGGLATALFFGWSRLQTQVTTYRLERDAMADMNKQFEAQLETWAQGFMKLAEDSGAGLVPDEGTAVRRLQAIRDMKPQGHDEFIARLAKSTQSMGKHLRETDPERHIQLGLSLFGVAMASAGFWLWWKRVQKPYDELMRLQLEAARRENQKQSAPQIGGSTG